MVDSGALTPATKCNLGRLDYYLIEGSLCSVVGGILCLAVPHCRCSSASTLHWSLPGSLVSRICDPAIVEKLSYFSIGMCPSSSTIAETFTVDVTPMALPLGY